MCGSTLSINPRVRETKGNSQEFKAQSGLPARSFQQGLLILFVCGLNSSSFSNKNSTFLLIVFTKNHNFYVVMI